MHLNLPTDGHLNAHLDDFLIPLDEVLARVRAAIPSDAPIGTPTAVYLTADTPLGWSRCVHAAGRRTWWGYRPDRTLPSHLAAGDREAVTVVTAWIRRESEDQVTLITVYPGGPAPSRKSYGYVRCRARTPRCSDKVHNRPKLAWCSSPVMRC